MCAALLLHTLSFAQKNVPLENGSIFWLKDGSKIIGEFVDSDDFTTKTKIITGDTVSLEYDMIRRSYLYDDIALFNRARFQYKNSLLLNYSIGLSRDHFNMDLSLNKRINRKFELGIGGGIHHNTSYFQTPQFFYTIDVVSFPIFAQGKYFFGESAVQFYVRGRVGVANNIDTWQTQEVSRGITMEGALGATFPTKWRLKPYFELGQYTSRAAGVSQTFGTELFSDIDFKVWFNRVVFTIGFEIGK